MEKNKSLLLIITIILFSVISISNVFGTQSKENPEIYLVALNHEKGNEEFSIQSNQISISEIQKNFLNDFSEEDFKVIYEYSNFPVIAIEATEENLRLIEKHPQVLSISENYKVYTQLEDVNNIIKSSNFIENTELNGTGQTVCVIDTGVDYNHNSLGGGWGNIVIAGARILDSNVENCTENNPSPCMDTHSHGTHVAGTIASQHETYRGVAPGVNIVAMNPMPGGSGKIGDIVKSIDWCVNNSDKYSISIISMSLAREDHFYSDIQSCESDNQPFTLAVNSATDAGIIVVAASGNKYKTNSLPAPACIGNVISVGSTTKTDEISTFSNRGQLLDFLAPGQDIISTVLNNNFGSKSGTSMATPAVSGAIALLNEYNQYFHGENLNVSQVREILNKTQDRISDGTFEYPRINLMDTLEFLSCFCNSCEDCNEKLIDENCTTVFLSDNVQSEDTCIFINSSDMIFNCYGKNIIGSNEGSGIYINNTENSKIINCHIKNFTKGITISNNSFNIHVEDTKLFENVLSDFYMSNNSSAHVNKIIIGNSTKNTTISFEARDIGLIYSEPIDIIDGFSHINHFLNISNTSESSWISLNIFYDEDNLSDLKENQKENLMMWKFNGTWNPIFESGISEDYIYSGNISIFSIFTTKVDTTNPNIELEINATEIEFAEDNIKINWTATDNHELDSVLLEIFYPNQTTIINSTNATGELILEPKILNLLGNYTIKLWANDTTGNQNSTNKTFEVIDSTLPEIKFVSPTTEAGTHNQKYIAVNVTTNNTDYLNKTTIYLYDEENMMYIQSTNETELYYNFTNLPDGTYFLNATVNNTNYGNIRTTETRKIILDTTPPTITIHSPKNKTYSSSTIDLKVTADEDVNTWWYSLNEAENQTFTPNTTITGLKGSNHLFVYANDSVGNTGEKDVYFTIRISTGGSGGGARTSPEDINDDEDIEEVYEPKEEVWTEDKKVHQSQMKEGDTLRFSIRNNPHRMNVIEVGKTYARFKINSEPIEVLVYKGYPVEIDLTGDGSKDIKININEIIEETIYFEIELLDLKEPIVDDIYEPISEVPNETIVEEIYERDIDISMLILIILLSAVIVILLYFNFYKIKN